MPFIVISFTDAILSKFYLEEYLFLTVLYVEVKGCIFIRKHSVKYVYNREETRSREFDRFGPTRGYFDKVG